MLTLIISVFICDTIVFVITQTAAFVFNYELFMIQWTVSYM